MVHYHRLMGRYGRIIAGFLLGLLLLVGISVSASSQLGGDPVVTITVSAYTIPTVVAYNATDIGADQATLQGGVSTGGIIVSRGFEWGNSTGNYTGSWNETGTFGLGTFNTTVTGLTNCTQVFWRAFAINGAGIGYSGELNFITSCLPLAPTNFIITQIGTNSISINWTMGFAAAETVIRVSENGYPATVADGYLAYNGTGTNVTVNGLTLSTVAYYYRAWSENSYGYSLDHAEAQTGGVSIMVIAFIAIALFFTWMSYKTRELLICLLTFFIWIALSLWLFFSNSGFFDLNQGYVKILAYVFFMISFIPLIWSMNQEIKHESQGKRWTTYGAPPKEKSPDTRAEYKKMLKKRLGS
jgi:hypothetical protein